MTVYNYVQSQALKLRIKMVEIDMISWPSNMQIHDPPPKNFNLFWFNKISFNIHTQNALLT